MTLGNRIRTMRTAKKYSQEYLAEQLNVSRQAVSKWETDISRPDTDNLIRLAELFGVSVDYLASGKERSNIQREETSRPYGLLKRLALVFFLLALASHCIGLLSGEFTKPLLMMFPYLWYGTSVWAVILNAFTALFTLGWICLLIAANVLRRNRRTGQQ